MHNKKNYKKWYETHKDEIRAKKRDAMKLWRQKNPEKSKEQSRNAKKNLKDKVFAAYGCKCTICGFNDLRALTLDHVKNNGSEERKIYGERGVYNRSLILENKHEYQILCMNCQFIKRVESCRQNQHG
jgi:hypothetical protein